MRESIKTASTREEAENLALSELGIDRENAYVEVLNIEEKGFLFFKKKEVTVKVTEKEDDFDVKAIFAQSETKPEEKKETKKEKQFEAKPEKKAEPKKEQPKKEAPVNKEEKPVEKVTEKPDVKAEDEIVPADQLSEKAKSAIAFLKSVIEEFHSGEYELIPVKTEKGVTIKISGEDMGVLIGKKGETMEALSYLTSLAANRSDDSYEKITVDVADYRQKKEKDLVNSAKKAAARVLKTGRSFGFEPMTPYDRRIIHAAISEIEGVKSESKGEGSQRRVIVYSENPRPRKERNDRGGRNDHKKGGRHDYRGAKKDKPVQAQKTREEKLVDVSSVGLYGKIEL